MVQRFAMIFKDIQALHFTYKNAWILFEDSNVLQTSSKPE